jgi:hypothetical protein
VGLLFCLAQRRGEIIGKVINLEKVIDGFISKNFIQEDAKRSELESLIIQGLPFAQKLLILYSLLNTYHSSIHKEHPKLEKDLEKIRKQRNIMAHSWLDVSPTYVYKRKKSNLQLSILTKNNKSIEYDEKRIKELSDSILKYTIVLMYW